MQTPKELSQIKLPASNSHKGQNGKLLVIGGSKLFHAASLWSLKVSSRIVDLVHYSSTPENNQIVQNAKEEFRDGIVISRDDLEAYIKEDDVILIGTGMTRDEETKNLTDKLLKQYPDKQWVIDAGALQMMDISLIPKKAILTPHIREFEQILGESIKDNGAGQAKIFASKYNCTILIKGEVDIISDGIQTTEISGGNAGMTKGGTGDVLAGLVAALATTNDGWVAAVAGSYINKQAGESLFKKAGYYFNASDLADEIPLVMKRLLIA